MEILDSLDQLQPGELLLSTCYGLSEDSLLASDLVARLNERTLAGIVIQPRYYVTDIPSKMIRQADGLDFPIIRLQPEITFGKVTRAILDFLTYNAMSRRESPILFHRGVIESERRGILKEFFDDLLEGNFHSYHEALTRAGSMGLEVSSPYRVAVVYAAGKDHESETLPLRDLKGARDLIVSHPLCSQGS